MFRSHPSRFGLSRFGTLLLAAAVLVPLLLLCIAAWRDYKNVELQVRQEVETGRDILQQYAYSQFLAHDVIAKNVIARIESMSWEEVQSSRAIHDYLVGIAAQFPQVHSIWISDAEGTARATNLMFPVPFITATHREYYRLLVATDDPIVVGKPFIVQAGEPEEAFNISFRITGRDGSFKGFIGTAISTAQFARIFETFEQQSAPDVVSSLFRKDGEVLVRIPRLEEGMPTSYAADTEFMSMLGRHDRFTYARLGSLDSVRRLYSYGRVTGFPLFIGHGVSYESITARWLANLRAYAAFVATAMLVLLALAAYAWRQHRQSLAHAANLETLVRERTQHLKRALDEKNALFREVHHRVKNNLQIIASLARLQGRHGVEDGQLERRVQAMALVHEMLYARSDATEVDLAEYTHRLCAALSESMAGNVKCTVEADSAFINLEQAIPFALILSEVVTNAFKHGRPAEGTLQVSVALRRDGDHLVLTVRDNGRGVDANFANGPGFGMKLVNSLAVQLDAAIEFLGSGGMTFRMRFPALPAAS